MSTECEISVPFGMDTWIEIERESEVKIPDPGTETLPVGKYNSALRAFAEEGNWVEAESLFRYDPVAVKDVVTQDSHTALHIAASARQWYFVEKLLDCMQPEDLELQETKYGYTALHTVVVEGNVEVAKAMVSKNRRLTQMRENNGSVPLKVAADYVTDRQEEMVKYLFSVTGDEEPSPFSGPLGASLLCSLIEVNFYDIALCVLQCYPNLGIEKSEKRKVTALEVMAGMPILSGCKLTFWQRWIYSVISEYPASSARKPMTWDIENPMPAVISEGRASTARKHMTCKDSTNRSKIITGFRGNLIKFTSICQSSFTRVPAVKRIYNNQLMHEKATALVKCMLNQLRETTSDLEFFEKSDVLKTAMKAGTTEFVVECLQTFPELIWHKTRNKRLLQVAVEERNYDVLCLMCKLSADHKNDLVSKRDDNGNTILHYAAKLGPFHQLKLVSGAPLQMQREMQWFKGVKHLLPEKYRLVRNKDGETAQQIFTKEHMNLVKKSEKWMKGTSESCILVTTLIATVAFAAAFTVPGGSERDTGIPIFLFRNAFMVFAIADALALFSSITSVLMFLSILTSRYAGVDFDESSPRKLIIGLATLCFSLATLMIAFCAALAIVLGVRLSLVTTLLVVLFTCVPVYLFSYVHFPIIIGIVRHPTGLSSLREINNTRSKRIATIRSYIP